MNSVTRFRTTRVKPCRLFGTAFLALALGACGGEAGNDGETQAVPGETPAGAPADQAGALKLGGTNYPFRIVHCDLSGNHPPLLRGTGTAPDGRSLTLEVGRLAAGSGDVVWESATLFLGSIADGNHWAAQRGGYKDGRWFVGQGMNEPAEGPLLQISGNELLVEGMFLREKDGTARDGVLRATCAS